MKLIKLSIASCFVLALVVIRVTIWTKDVNPVKGWSQDRKFKWGITSFGFSALLMVAGIILAALQIFHTCCYQ